MLSGGYFTLKHTCVLNGDRAEAELRIKATCFSSSGSLRFQGLASLGFRLNSASKLWSDFGGQRCPLGPVCLEESLRELEDHVMPGPSLLQLAKRRFFFYGWFSAQELAFLSGNLPASQPQPLLSLNCSLPEQNRVCNLLPGSPLPPSLLPSLPSWDFSLGGGGALGKREGGEAAAARLLPAASLLFLSPFPPLAPPPPTETQPHTF